MEISANFDRTGVYESLLHGFEQRESDEQKPGEWLPGVKTAAGHKTSAVVMAQGSSLVTLPPLNPQKKSYEITKKYLDHTAQKIKAAVIYNIENDPEAQKSIDIYNKIKAKWIKSPTQETQNDLKKANAFMKKYAETLLRSEFIKTCNIITAKGKQKNGENYELPRKAAEYLANQVVGLITDITLAVTTK